MTIAQKADVILRETLGDFQSFIQAGNFTAEERRRMTLSFITGMNSLILALMTRYLQNDEGIPLREWLTEITLALNDVSLEALRTTDRVQ